MSLKTYLIIAALVGGFLLLGAAYSKGKNDERKACQLEKLESERKALDESIEIDRKQKNILTRPLSPKHLAERLRGNTI